MKKIILTLFLTFATTLFSYDFPLKNRYIATAVGSSTLMTPNIMEKIPLKEYRIEFTQTRKIPANLEYQEDYKFSMALQDKKAPLVFILSGTGSSATSYKTKLFERIFYTAGYHVVGVSSMMNTNSIVSLSYDKMPGILLNDSMDIYRAMKEIKKFVEKKAEISDYYLTGYSLGGTHSAMVSYIDESEKDFNFKRVFVINPAVNLYTSANILDDMLESETKGDIGKIFAKVDEIINELAKVKTLNLKNGADEIFKYIKVTDDDLKLAIGVVFRLTAIDINFLSDVTNNRKVYVDEEISKYQNMGPIFKKINFADFSDYVKKLAVPYYNEKYGKTMDIKKLKEFTDLKVIEPYFRNSNKMMVVTNNDELILTRENINYLKDVFKGRIIVYPTGGHCGNMYYYENVRNMLNFMKGGKLVERKK